MAIAMKCFDVLLISQFALVKIFSGHISVICNVTVNYLIHLYKTPHILPCMLVIKSKVKIYAIVRDLP